MRNYLTLLLAGAILLLSSCATKGDIDNLQSQIDGLKSGQIATIENQISSITSLQEADREIKGYISALQNTALELQKSINSADGKIDDLEKALVLVNTAIENLKAKDSALEQRITDLKDYVDTQLRGAKDWVSATFATLEQYNGIVSEIGGLRGSINSINTAMQQMESRLDGKITSMKGEIEAAYTKAIGTLDTSLKNWVNEQLKGYWTIAETEAKLIALRGSLEKEDESIRGDLDKLSTSLDSAKTELTEGYKAAIKKAIDENNGLIDGKISEAVSGLNTRIDSEVSMINKRIDAIEKRVADLETQVSALVSRIQSLTYIPRYTDGASTMWVKMKSDGTYGARDTLEFRVSPSECADVLAKVWGKAVSAEAITLSTRVSQETVSLPVVSVTGGNGKISVVLDGSSLGDSFFIGEKQMKAVVIISDGNNERTSEYVSMVAKEDSTIPNNIILYTSYDGEIITPYNSNAFGARIISNSYKDGRGILVFNRAVTSIGQHAFLNCSELTSIILSNTVTSIGELAFQNCPRLTSIVIPDMVTSIGQQAFSSCSGLTSIVIPNSVTSINGATFNNCSGLTSIVIPDSVTSIGAEAFTGCSGLTSIVIPDSVTSIGGGAFRFCSGLTSIIIPDSVTSIGGGIQGPNAFEGCYGLTSVIVDPNNPNYDSRNDCNAIIETSTNSLITGCKTTIIPDSATSIGYLAFRGIPDLTIIRIPTSVISIERYAFWYCTGLTSIIIPESVTSIGQCAFEDCDNLTSITLLANTPCTIGMASFPHNCQLFVPAEAVQTYKTAQGWWTVWTKRIQAIPGDIYSSNVPWTNGTNAYDDGMATVNGVENVKIYKLGTSTKVGTATIVVPKGAKSVSFYGVSWKGNPATVLVKMGDSVIYSQDLAANDGASGNSPYTISVTDNDLYTMTLPSQLTEDTTFTITTSEGGKTRIGLFGIKAQ